MTDDWRTKHAELGCTHPSGCTYCAWCGFDVRGMTLLWTTERPTKPGWYWALAGKIPCVVWVVDPAEGIIHFGDDRAKWHEFSAWAGPIPDPIDTPPNPD